MQAPCLWRYKIQIKNYIYQNSYSYPLKPHNTLLKKLSILLTMDINNNNDNNNKHNHLNKNYNPQNDETTVRLLMTMT